MLMEVQWFSLSVCVFTGHILMLKMLPVFDNYMYFPENKLNIQIESSLKYLLKMKFYGPHPGITEIECLQSSPHKSEFLTNFL